MIHLIPSITLGITTGGESVRWFRLSCRQDLGRAFRLGEQLQYGIVNINEGSAYWQPHTPFGGYSGKTSGFGRLGGRYTLEEMTQVKQIVFDIGS